MKIIFLVDQPLTRYNYDRFGFKIINDHGVDVECWDVAKIIWPKIWEKKKAEVFKFPGYIQVSLINQIKKLCDHLNNVVAIDQLGIGFCQ